MLNIDKLSRKPIYEQIVDGICKEISTGLMKEGDQLPSVRELSVLLSTNPNTIQKAYIELDRRGIITSAPGRGSFVRQGAMDAIRSHTEEQLDELSTTIRRLALAKIPKERLYRLIDETYAAVQNDTKEENT